MNMQSMIEQVAVVTGSGSGMGRAAALAFTDAGARVVIGNRNVQQGEETVRLIEDLGGKAIFVPTDVTQEADVKRLIDKAVSTYGRLDFAFNNAGVDGNGVRLVDATEEHYNKIMDTNVKGVWLSMKYELAQMLQQGKGAIVNNSSVLGTVAMAEAGIYTASKHAVIGLTRIRSFGICSSWNPR